MLKEEINSGTNKWARICDTCHSAPSTIYCRTDSAFLCRTCDARIHMASRHERVWVCESCERAPAAFLCKADAASLCTTCDSDIHSANPLARRHHRVPILPIPGTLYGGPDIDTDDDLLTGEADETDEDEAASWLLINPDRDNNQQNPFDEYLDLDEFNSDQQNQFSDQFNNQQQQQYSVPEQKSHGNESGEGKKELHQQQHYQNFQLGMDYDNSNTEYGYPASFSHTVSISSVLDVGIVPESTMSDVSVSHHQRPPKGTIDLFSGPPIPVPSQLNPTDREARVMRYREKKKARKFEKTIRYASRKAYAETRPRIKGRFAKRTTEMDVEVDQMFSTSLMTENGYGIVPSF